MSAVDHPDCTRSVRVQPRVGGPLVVGWTDFPGVVLAYGHWGGAAGPVCGCDACDEAVAEVADDLDRHIEAYVSGLFTETLSRDPLRYATTTGAGAGWNALTGEQLTAMSAVAEPGTYEWSAWSPRRYTGQA